jgi:hypothetical protein
MSFRKLSVVMVFGAVLGVAACSDDDTGPERERFTASLTGGAERPTAVTTTATGDAVVEFTPTGLTWVVNVNGITAVTAAHIHSPATHPDGTANVVLGLNPQLGDRTGVLTAGEATATGTAVSMDSLKAHIRSGRAYVNVHNTANPGGHIRGQLVPAN